MTRNFELKKLVEKFNVPQKIVEKEDSSLWHWQDHKFKLPKTIAMVQIYVDPGRNLQSVKRLSDDFYLEYDAERQFKKYVIPCSDG